MATVEHDVEIEPGSSGDLEGVMKVMNGAFGHRFGEAWTRSQLAGILPMSGVCLILARERGNHPVGFSLFRTVGDESELLLLGVLPSFHRRGVGRRLLEDFLERARNEAVARVHLEVRDGNPAIQMYHSAGFSAVGQRRDYYRAPDGRRFDAITLARAI
ncbi:MAG TPA: GNAT family N-acetyltransferase [Sphingomicrobium sp.]|nr:GNAT family N-acetyltransferase [Sphingomicrobium sp.]